MKFIFSAKNMANYISRVLEAPLDYFETYNFQVISGRLSIAPNQIEDESYKQIVVECKEDLREYGVTKSQLKRLMTICSALQDQPLVIHITDSSWMTITSMEI